MTCRDEPKCKLAGLGCRTIHLSGNSAANVMQSQESEYKDCDELPVLGPQQFDLMIIGEVPSVKDDKTDMVFQDPASHLISGFIEKAGLDPTRIWMTKIIKCLPPKGRKATVSEINICREYLKEEIKLIQPKVIMLVGAPSLRAFNLTGQGSINSIRGKVFECKLPDWEESPVFKVIPTLNPGMFHYKPNPKLKNRVAEDYRVAKAQIEGKQAAKIYVPDWRCIDSLDKLDEMIEEIKQTKIFAFDTESCHLGFRKAPFICFSFAWGKKGQCAVLPWSMHDPDAPEDQKYHLKDGFGLNNERAVVARLKTIFEDKEIAKAAHNIKYDLNVVRYHTGIKINGFLYDTMIMKHLLDENPPSDLEFLCDLEMGWGDYSAEKRKITGHGKKLRNTYDKVPDSILHPYACTDAEGTFNLLCRYHKALQEKPNLWKVYCEESEPGIKALVKGEWWGSRLDLKVIDKLEKEYTDDQTRLLINIRKDTWPDFNPNSPPQVQDALLKKGFEVEIKDEASASGYSANKTILNEIKDKCPIAGDILLYRTKQKMISTYLINARNDVDSDGRIRYSWMQHGTVTGRLSCRFMHQIPKIDENRVAKGLPVMRDMFVVNPGYQYVYGDFSQIELWILAILARDVEMYRILAEGGDLHRTTAYEFLRTVWPGLTEALISKFNRTEVGKRVNFGLGYGSEGYSLVKTGKWQDQNLIERPFTWDMINMGMASWKARFHGVGAYLSNTPDLVRSFGGTATNIYGRERRFGSVLSSYNDQMRKAAERECVNFFIQSVAGAVTIRTLIEIDRMLDSHIEAGRLKEEDIFLINTVHDSLAYEVKDRLVEWFSAAMNAIATRHIVELGNHQFKMDVGTGINWTTAEMAA